MIFNKKTLIKTPVEIEKIRAASKVVALVHKELKPLIKPGITLKQLDKIAYDIIIANNAKPAFLGYEGFAGTICASVNDVLVHGVPNDYVLKEGDIVSIDVGAQKDGYFGDAAFTMGVGKINKRHELLLSTSKLCLSEALKALKPGIKTGDLGNLIFSIASKNGFAVPYRYTGHGIGKQLHEDPYIPNYGTANTGEVLKEGMVICIEPMLIDGEDDLYVDLVDKWSVKTTHGGYCAHDEHTILITKKGCEVLA